MRLGDLAGVDSEVEIVGAAIDSRKVTAGCLFGAFPGSVHNGEDFIASAVERGAVAVVARPQARVAGALHLADAEPRRLFATLAAKLLAPYPEIGRAHV